MEPNKWVFISIGIFLLSLVMLDLCTLFFLDASVGTNQSLRDRVASLEDKMIERVKPVIQINRATIYNTEGEIVIEKLEKK